jgi:cell division protein DivIC
VKEIGIFETSFTTGGPDRLSGGPPDVNFRRLIIFLYFVVFVGMAAASGVFFWHTRQEYSRLLSLERQSRQRLAEAQLKLQEQQRMLDRLRNDPSYVETVIRRRLGYAKPDETIFRFEP